MFMDLWNRITPRGKAATLVIIFYPPSSQEPHVVVTTRALHLRNFPGEAALPGGMAENGESALQTALREAKEEIGFDPILTGPYRKLHLVPQLSKNYLLVQPCAIEIERPCELAELAPHISSDEVSATFSVQLSRLIESQWLDTVEEIEFPPGHPTYYYSFRRDIFSTAMGSTGVPAPIHGMTARILVDAARSFLKKSPDFLAMTLDDGAKACHAYFSQKL